MVARIVVLVLPSQVPDQGIVRPQDSTERSWFKVSRFCYMLMKYSCDRRRVSDVRLQSAGPPCCQPDSPATPRRSAPAVLLSNGHYRRRLAAHCRGDRGVQA